MATSLYNYNKNDTLVKIANRFSTNVTTLVRLNSWLKDPNDGHTYITPSKARTQQFYEFTEGANNSSTAITLAVHPSDFSIVIYATNHSDTITKYVQLSDNTFSPVGIVDRYDSDTNSVIFNNFIGIKKIVIEYKPSTVLSSLIVPLVGNGNTSVEDYWNNLDDLLGLSYNNTIDNFLATSANSPAEVIDSRTFESYPASLDKYTMDYIIDDTDASVNEDLRAYSISDFAVADVGSIIQQAINNSSPSSNYSFKKYNTDKLAPSIEAYSSPSSYEVRGGSNRGNKFEYINVGDVNNNMYGRCKIIIYDVENKKNITLNMPCYPEGVTDSVKADYASNNPLGRSEPFNVYTNTSERSIDFSFVMHREMTNNRNDIETIVNYIESAVYPDYSGNIAPIRVQVDIAGQVYISGFVPSASVEWFGAIGDDYKYNQVNIRFTVTESTGVPKSAGYIQSHGSYRD